MTLVWTASELLTGQKFQDKSLMVAFKNGRQSFSSTTALQWDADLTLTLLQTSAVYSFDVAYGATGQTTADLVTAWDVTGDAIAVRTTQAMASGGTTSSVTNLVCREQSTDGWLSGTALIPAQCAIREKFTVTTSTQPCTLTLRWAQNVSNTTATSIHDYGWAVARRLN